MSVELLQTLSLVSFILAGVLFLASIALFFVLDVKKIIGDLSGANARKVIENIRKQNENSGDKAYKPSSVNVARGRITEKMTPSGRLPSSAKTGTPVMQKYSTTELLPQSEETTVLSSSETTVLSSSETTVLSGGVGYGVEPQSHEYVATAQESVVAPQAEFSIDVEMGYSESAEIIE